MSNHIFKVGDEVECLVFGEGIVDFTDGDHRTYVIFTSGKTLLYIQNGCPSFGCVDTRRTLYHRGTVKVVEIEKDATNAST